MRAAVVGGTGGLGRTCSRLLASRGWNVLVVGQTFRDADVPGIEFVKADLSLMGEAERVAKELPAEKLDLVVFTTGIFAAPVRQETAEGLERDMAVSFLSRLVILRGIAERLGVDRPPTDVKPRVFVMGYPGSGQKGAFDDLNAEKSYKALQVHMNTVAGNEMLVLDGAQRYKNIGVFGLNPGIIKTNIRDNFLGEGSLKSRIIETVIGWVSPSAETYAERIVPLFDSRDLEGQTGLIFNQKGKRIPPSKGLDEEHVRAFLAAAEELVARAKH